jgi:hypothetical protein
MRRPSTITECISPGGTMAAFPIWTDPLFRDPREDPVAGSQLPFSASPGEDTILRNTVMQTPRFLLKCNRYSW